MVGAVCVGKREERRLDARYVFFVVYNITGLPFILSKASRYSYDFPRVGLPAGGRGVFFGWLFTRYYFFCTEPSLPCVKSTIIFPSQQINLYLYHLKEGKIKNLITVFILCCIYYPFYS